MSLTELKVNRKKKRKELDVETHQVTEHLVAVE